MLEPSEVKLSGVFFRPPPPPPSSTSTSSPAPRLWCSTFCGLARATLFTPVTVCICFATRSIFRGSCLLGDVVFPESSCSGVQWRSSRRRKPLCFISCLLRCIVHRGTLTMKPSCSFLPFSHCVRTLASFFNILCCSSTGVVFSLVYAPRPQLIGSERDGLSPPSSCKWLRSRTEPDWLLLIGRKSHIPES